MLPSVSNLTVHSRYLVTGIAFFLGPSQIDAKVIHVAKFGQIAVIVTAATLMVVPTHASANTITPTPTAKPKPTRTATAVLPALRMARTRLNHDIRRIWTHPYLRRGKTAVYVVDAKTGEELYSVHEDLGMNPASNVKLVATATALDLLGPDWRYQTNVYGPTPDQHGVVKGDLYLYGDHDGSLAPEHIEGLANRIAAKGIKRIDGDVLVGNGVRDAIAWPWTYITLEGGANLNEAPTASVYPPSDFVRVKVEAKTSWARGAWAHTKRPRIVTDPDGRKVVEVTVAGAIRVRRKQKLKRWIPMRSVYTASILRSALIAAGVEVTGVAKRKSFETYVRSSVIDDDFLPIELSSHKSAPLAQLIKKVNKYSDNMLADLLTMTIGRKAFGGAAGLSKGTRAMTAWLGKHADVSRTPVVLDTGSGLSYKTKISARQIVRTLRVAAGYDQTDTFKHADLFRKSLAIAGRDGTLRRRFIGTQVRGRLSGKTGTLSSVIALSGFLHGPGERTLAFSIVTNDTRRHLRWGVRRQHEQIVYAMQRFLSGGTPTWVAATRPR